MELPTDALLEAVSVRVAVAIPDESTAEMLPTEPVTPVGSPVTVKVGVPVRPAAIIWTLLVAVDPCTTTGSLGAANSAKSPPEPTTLTIALSVAIVVLPEVAVIVSGTSPSVAEDVVVIVIVTGVGIPGVSVTVFDGDSDALMPVTVEGAAMDSVTAELKAPTGFRVIVCVLDDDLGSSKSFGAICMNMLPEALDGISWNCVVRLLPEVAPTAFTI